MEGCGPFCRSEKEVVQGVGEERNTVRVMANRRSPTPHPVVLIQEMRVSLAVADLKGFDGASCEK
jgi:hypothetical protein